MKKLVVVLLLSCSSPQQSIHDCAACVSDLTSRGMCLHAPKDAGAD